MGLSIRVATEIEDGVGLGTADDEVCTADTLDGNTVVDTPKATSAIFEEVSHRTGWSSGQSDPDEW